MSISPSTLANFFFIKYPADILRVFNALLPLKGVEDPEFYLGGDLIIAEINGEVMHSFLISTYIKNMS